MNKNKTLKIWRRVTKLSATFLLGLLVLSSCKKEENTVGGNINPNGLNVIFTDTFTVLTYSDNLDSLETDETFISLLGAYNDPEFGKVDCGVVTQLRLSSENPDFGSVQSIDSVVLSFMYSGIKYYNNISDLNFEVFEITDELVRDDQDYYAFTSINTTGTSLVLGGSETISPKPYNTVVVNSDTLNPQLRIHLDQAFGQTLIDNQSQMSTNDAFISYFKGLYVKVTDAGTFASGDGTILYLSLEDALSKMVVYYTNTASEQKSYTFNINGKTARFNKVDFDRVGTDVQTILDNTDLGQEKFYIQGSGIRAVIELPFIFDLYKDKKRILNKAELIVPVQDFNTDGLNPIPELFIGRINDKFNTDFTKDYSSFSFVEYDEDKKEFRFLMTQEIQAVLNEQRENTGYRIFPRNFFGSTIERIILNGANSSLKNKTRLEITYTEY